MWATVKWPGLPFIIATRAENKRSHDLKEREREIRERDADWQRKRDRQGAADSPAALFHFNLKPVRNSFLNFPNCFFHQFAVERD